MAKKVISIDDIMAYWHSQVHDPDKWDLNMKLLRAVGIFAGSIIIFRKYGDMMAI